MSGLILNITADQAGLTQVNQAIIRLETLLTKPVSADMSALTGQISALNVKTTEANASLTKTQKALAATTAATKATAAGAKTAGEALGVVAAGAETAKASVNLLNSSLSVFTAEMTNAAGVLEVNTSLLGLQAAEAKILQANMALLSVEQRNMLRDAQGLVGVTALLNQEFQLQAELVTIEAASHNVLLRTMKAETVASAQLLLSKGLITQARFDDIAGTTKEASATQLLVAEFTKEITGTNLLTASHSELVRMRSVSAQSAHILTKTMQEQGAAASALLVKMEALSPAVRSVMVAEQGSVGVMSAANAEMALQAELTGLMAVGQSAYIKTLKAETLALAKLALIKGSINQQRYNEIAGIEKVVVGLNAETAAINKVTVASRQATAAQAQMNGVMRGAAGATGTLWLSYGAILPLLATFAVVLGTIKGYKAALDFEYAIGYMEALGKATGDTTASLEELKSGLLGIKDVAHGPNDLAISLKALMKAGFGAAESMKEIQTLSRLATIAEEDLAVTTTAVISQFRAWSVESVGAARGVATMSEAANVLAAAALTTTLDVGELAKMMKYTPVLATQSAASFVELTAALGTMSNMGVRGTTAATSLRTAMLQLQSPTTKTRKLLRDLGLEVDLFTDEGKLRSMSGLFDALATSLKGVADKKRLELLKSMFSIRAGSAGAVMLDQFNRAIQEGTFSFKAQVEMLEKVKNEGRFINDMYEDISKTTSVLWDETKASWERVAVGILNTDTIKAFVKNLKDFADSGALAVLAKQMGMLVSASGHLANVVVKPTRGIMSFIGDLGTDISELRASMFGADEQFMSSLNAVGLYAREKQGLIDRTYEENSAARILIDTYGSLKVAAQVAPLDAKIGSLQGTIERLEEGAHALRSALNVTPEGSAKDGIRAQLEELRALRWEYEKLRKEKAELLRDPEAYEAKRAALEAKKAGVAAKIEENAATLAYAIDRRAIELHSIKLARADALAGDQFELKLLEQKHKDKLISLEDYRAKKKTITDKMLQDDMVLLQAQWELADTKWKEAVKESQSDTAVPGAGKAAIAAETKRDKIRKQIEQKFLDGVRANVIFSGESNSIKLANEKKYAEDSVATESARIEAVNRFDSESLASQTEKLDARHAADLISEVAYLEESRNLKRKAFAIEESALKDRAALLKTQRDEALKLKDPEEQADAVGELDKSITKVSASLATVAANKDGFEDIVTLEDVATAKEFSKALEGISRAAADMADEADFDLSIRTMDDDEQKLSKDRRGNQLERESATADVMKEGWVGVELESRITDVNEAYDEIDARVLSSYEKQQEAQNDFYGGAQKGLNDYIASTEDMFGSMANMVSNAFSNMEDAMVDFVTTGKFSFTDFANSLIKDMVRMAIQQSIMGPLASAFGSWMGGMGGSTYALGTPGASAGPALADGGVFANAKLQPFADGGIVNSPTVFPFANGTGLMGEAGPEAIMPLTRINGKLGVEASGSGGGGSVTVNNYGDAKEVDVQQKNNSSGGTDIVITLEKALSDRIKTRGSGLSRTLESTYGFKRVGGR